MAYKGFQSTGSMRSQTHLLSVFISSIAVSIHWLHAEPDFSGFHPAVLQVRFQSTGSMRSQTAQASGCGQQNGFQSTGSMRSQTQWTTVITG